jgi:hypothetical protein
VPIKKIPGISRTRLATPTFNIVALRSQGTAGLELIDIYGNDRIAFQAKAAGTITAYDGEGQSLGKVALSSQGNGWREFKPLPAGRRYVAAGAMK